MLHNLSPILITIIVVLLYALYYIVAYSSLNKRIYRTFAAKINETVFHSVFFRLSGFVIFGLLSAFIFHQIYGVKFDFLTQPIEHFKEMLPWTIALFLIAIIIPYMNVRNSKRSQYPQFKIENWTISYQLLSYTTWMLYLMGYEFMFRGILLFGTVGEMGYYPAIILNVVLYALAHIPKGWKEVLGCFILGPILCAVALYTHNIIIPTILHITVCLCNEYFSIRKVRGKLRS
jgi:membrane protease YdiL (CAAX protease family)